MGDIKNEDKKKWLMRYRYAKRRAERIEREIQRIREEKENPSLKIDDMPHGMSTSDLSDYMVKLEIYHEMLIKEKKKALEVKTEIIAAIKKIDSRYQDVMIYRYIDGMKWEEVCCFVGVEWAQVHRIHAKALKEIKTRGKKE